VEGGGVVARQWYYPYGAVRTSDGTLPTKRTDTGQTADDTGLYFYNARYYSPYLNRWLQPDTIVPEPSNPQDLNRYAYGRNNPLRFIDPSGHFSEEAVQAYLRSYYGEDQWEKVFNAWKGNKDWWAMISAAQAGSLSSSV
jgi:RHS repeat-associated protein